MMGSWTYLLPTGTSTPQWTSGIGAQPGPSGRSFSAISTGLSFRKFRPRRGAALRAGFPPTGAPFGDLFNDGRIDVVLNNMDSAPTLLRNAVKNTNHWITFRLVGGSKSPRDA